MISAIGGQNSGNLITRREERELRKSFVFGEKESQFSLGLLYYITYVDAAVWAWISRPKILRTSPGGILS